MTSSSRFARRLILSILPAALLAGHPLHPTPARAAELPDWEDPQVLGINKLDPHAPVYPFADEATARGLDRSKSPYYRLLNGRWKFRFSPHPEARPKAFFETAFDDAAWDTIPVPSNIEKHGYAPPLYVNIGYAWGWGTPPRVPHDQNYVGSYRHRFEVPASWQGRRVRITFQGVSAGFYLWVNGRKIGYSEDSRGPAEFDVTDAVVAGENLLAVEVYRFTDGAYLEAQDFWRLSGIFRDVVLWSTDPVHVADFRVVTDLDAQYRDATLKLDVTVAGATDAERAFTLEAALLDAAGQAPLPALSPRPGRAGAGQTATVSVEAPVARPAEVVGREAEPLHAAADPEGRGRAEPRRRALAGRLPRGRDEGREDPRQRPAHPHPRRQPPRVGPRDRPVRARGHDGEGHRDPQAAQLQPRPHRPLPERARVVRARRPLRGLPHRRVEHRVARDGLRPRPDAREQAGVGEGPPRPHPAERRDVQEPRLGDHLVARQRGGRRRQLRGRVEVDPRARPDPSRPLRAGRAEGARRHRQPHVPDRRGHGPRGGERRPPAPHPVRVLARDGQQQRRLRRVLEGLRVGRPRPRRRDLGLGRPGPPRDHARRASS